MAQAEAGKGSKPRKEQDLNAYSDGYDRIFGNRPKKKPYVYRPTDTQQTEQKKDK